jgi:hypothetical protein
MFRCDIVHSRVERAFSILERDESNMATFDEMRPFIMSFNQCVEEGRDLLTTNLPVAAGRLAAACTIAGVVFRELEKSVENVDKPEGASEQ